MAPRPVRLCAAIVVLAASLPLVAAGQETPLHAKATVAYRDVELAEVLKDLANQSGVRFVCPDELVKGLEKVTYSTTQQEIGRIAGRILRPRGLTLAKLAGGQVAVEKLDVADAIKSQRQGHFEFAEKPTVARDGDHLTIRFAVKDFCDATVAIEDGGGRIVRHLASGVLGENAPDPFLWNTKKQEIVWDGKDDRGAYADNKDELLVRVSLGLKPQFEKTLFHSPYKRFGRNQPVMAAAPEGVYVYEGDMADSIRLFDHEGNYVRTVYPFPAGKLEQVKGLRWHATPDGDAKVPFKEGSHQVTFFGSGYNGGYDPATGYGQYRLRPLNEYDGLPTYPAASTMAVHGDRLALVGFNLVRLATDGNSGGLDMHGPRTGVRIKPNSTYAANTPEDDMPRSAVFSPDGKWLYLSGYTWYESRDTGGATRQWLHGVLKVALDGQADPDVFAGSIKQDDATAGTGEKQFNCPTAVACDGDGRVYVSDYVNNRIQVFTPDGKFKETIAVNRPAHVAVHQKTGEIYVFSWTYSHNGIINRTEFVEPKLTRFEAQPGHKKIAEYALPLGKECGSQPWGGWMGVQYRVELDSWAEQPTVWLVPEQAGGSRPWAQWGIKLLTVEKDKLAVRKDFGVEALKAVTCDIPSSGRQRLSADPKTGKVYIMEGMGTAPGDRVVAVDPATGKDAYVDLPFGAEDICFDIAGLAYLRTGETVVRYDPANWREVPWDYGEELDGVTHCGGRAAKVLSGLVVPGSRPGPWYHCGGFGISAKGHLVVQCYNGGSGSNAKLDRPGEQKLPANMGKPYEPQIYPGRQRWGEIHIWDERGKWLGKDVAPGITVTDGVGIDKDDNVYVLTNPMRTPNGKRAFNPQTETLIKFNRGRGKVITSGNEVPVPVRPGQEPAWAGQLAGFMQGPAWVEGAEWMVGGVGYSGTWRCTCWNARFSLDYFARSFAPEPDNFCVAVLDTAGNVIVRIGRPGNVEDGKPLVPDPVIKEARSIGGDETAIMHCCYVAVDTDKRLFIGDAGNRRIASVKLGYATAERVPLKDVPDQAPKK